MAEDRANPFDAALRKGKHRGKLVDRVPPPSPPIVDETPRAPQMELQPTATDYAGAAPKPSGPARMKLGRNAAGTGGAPQTEDEAIEARAVAAQERARRLAAENIASAPGFGNAFGLFTRGKPEAVNPMSPEAIDAQMRRHDPAAFHANELRREALLNGGPRVSDPNAVTTMTAPGGGGPAPGATAAHAGGGGGGGPAPGPHEEWRVGPSVRGAFGEADALAQDAIAARAAATGQAGQDEAATLEKLQRQQAERAAQAELREKDRRAVLMSYQEQADTLADEAANQKIDSKRLWASKDTGEKIAGIASMVIGGFLQGLRGGKNEAADAFDREVQQDIDAQVANLTLKGKGADRAQGLVGIAMSRFADQRAAEGAAYSAAMAQAELELKRQAALNKGAGAQVFAKDAIAALQQKRAERLSQMVAYVQPGAGGGAPAAHGIDEGRLVTMPDGTQVYAPSEKEGMALRKQAGGVANIVALTDEAVKLRDNAMAFVPGTDAHARLKNIQAELTFQVKNAAELGALSGPDMGLVHQAVGNVTSVMPGGSAQLKSAGQHAQQIFKRTVIASGVPIVQSGYQQDAKGNIKRVGGMTGQSYQGGGGPGAPAAVPPSFQRGQ